MKQTLPILGMKGRVMEIEKVVIFKGVPPPLMVVTKAKLQPLQAGSPEAKVYGTRGASAPLSKEPD